MSSLEPFNTLVKLTSRAFYDNVYRGMSVVILDALTRRQWVKEEDLAKDLKIQPKQLRRTLRFFEEEKLIVRDHRKEKANLGEKINKDYSYCCLDYSQIYDVVRYRLHYMKKQLKDELDGRNIVHEYVCPDCRRMYDGFDSIRLVSSSQDDGLFHCESCDAVLVDKDDNARERREKFKDMLDKMEVQLKPLMEQVNLVKDLVFPEFGTLQEWEAARANAAVANCGSSSDLNGTVPLPFLGETRVEVALLSSHEVKDAVATKVLPPWMIKEGMNLTKEQRGDEEGMNLTKEQRGDGEELKIVEKEDEKSTIQDEYVKAYYAAILKRQQEQELTAAAKSYQVQEVDEGTNTLASNSMCEMSSDLRRVGMKSKRDEDEDEIDWEDG